MVDGVEVKVLPQLVRSVSEQLHLFSRGVAWTTCEHPQLRCGRLLRRTTLEPELNEVSAFMLMVERNRHARAFRQQIRSSCRPGAGLPLELVRRRILDDRVRRAAARYDDDQDARKKRSAPIHFGRIRASSVPLAMRRPVRRGVNGGTPCV